MKKTALCLLFAMLAGLLCACPRQKPLTFAQIQMREASEQCKSEATSMNSEPVFGVNPFWTSYYEMCMNRFGYNSQDLKQLWY